jgi:hypothetical protein
VRNSAWFLAPEIVLIAGLSLARGETVETDVSWNPWWLRAVTQAPVTMPLSKATVVPPSDLAAYPPSGVLPPPPSAPVAVPFSGILQAPLERRTITTTSVKLAPIPRSAGVTAHTRTARHFVPRRTAARNPTQQKREDVARNARTARATTVHETTATQHVVVVTAATVPTAVRPRYFNYAGPAALSRSSTRTLSANKVPVLSSARPLEAAIAVSPTTPMPIYRYVYETDRIHGDRSAYRDRS